MKVLIFTTVWKRPEVTELTYKGFDRIQATLKDSYDIDTQVLIVSSEPEHTKIAKERGYNVFETENFPVATKYNNGLKASLDYEWDYILEMNSNNLLSDLYIHTWVAGAKAGLQVFGSRNFFALMPNKIDYKQYLTSQPNRISSVGRGIKRSVLEGVEGDFVTDLSKDSNLDGMSNKVFGRNIIQPIAFKCFPAVLDIKTGEDMHHHSNMLKQARIPYLISIFPELKYWV
jgi:hypothetical protein